MNPNLTEIVFILDCSGSMAGLEADTIGGFNAMIAKQQKEPGEALISTVLFNHMSTVVSDRAPVQRVVPLDGRTYRVGGSTALYDAVGSAIRHIRTVHRYARKEDVPARTLFVITTDGMENASHHYSGKEVRAMIQAQQEQYHWEFLFLGANINAEAAADSIGIHADHAVNYCCDKAGTALNFEAISDAVRAVRSSQTLDAGWKAPIVADYKRRSKHGGRSAQQ
mgnify:FL=1